MNLSTQMSQKLEKAQVQADVMAAEARERRFELAELERQRQKSLIESQDMEDIVEESLAEKRRLRQRFLQRQSLAEVGGILVF